MTEPEWYEFDPYDHRQTQALWDTTARMRQERPVARPRPGFVFVSRYADNLAVQRDLRRFSTGSGWRSPGVVVPVDERALGELDPPMHTRLRRMLLPMFTPAGARAVEPWTRAQVGRRLDAVLAAGGGDLVRELAEPIVHDVACHVLGVPDELHDQMSAWSHELLHSTWPAENATERGRGIAGAFPEFAAALDGLIADRRRAGDDAPDDVLTKMVRACDDDGTVMSDVQIRSLAVNVISGANSATYMLGNLLRRYLTDEDGVATALYADPARAAGVVEESLRYEAPVLFVMRTATEDVEIGGCPVHAGERVILGLSSANRDDAVYDDADRFVVDRQPPREQQAFGLGPHICLGNHLSRMEGRVVLEELVARLVPGQLRLVDGWVEELVPMYIEYGPESLPVVVTDGRRTVDKQSLGR